MAHGKMVCIGSSLFLKNKYGVGYNLTVSIKSDANPDFARNERITCVTLPCFLIEKSNLKCEALVKDFVQTATELSAAGTEIQYRLPFDKVCLS